MRTAFIIAMLLAAPAFATPRTVEPPADPAGATQATIDLNDGEPEADAVRRTGMNAADEAGALAARLDEEARQAGVTSQRKPGE